MFIFTQLYVLIILYKHYYIKNITNNILNYSKFVTSVQLFTQIVMQINNFNKSPNSDSDPVKD